MTGTEGEGFILRGREMLVAMTFFNFKYNSENRTETISFKNRRVKTPRHSLDRIHICPTDDRIPLYLLRIAFFFSRKAATTIISHYRSKQKIPKKIASRSLSLRCSAGVGRIADKLREARDDTKCNTFKAVSVCIFKIINLVLWLSL